VQAVEEEVAVYLLNMIDRITGKAPSSQSQGIDASIAKGFARCFGIGGDIFSHQGTTRNQGMHADPYKLMNGAASANNCPFVDGDVPSHLYGVSYNHVVADDTVMGNVHISHQKTGFSYFGCLFINGATVDGHALAYGGVISNFYSRFFTLKFKVLGDGRYNCSGKYFAIFADSCAGINGNVGTNPGAVTNFHIVMNRGKCFNGDVFPELSICVYF